MAKYLQISFHTLKGIQKFIDLGDSAYGEWIIYDEQMPIYHVNCFDNAEPSNVIVNSIINNKRLSIEDLLKRINSSQGTKLSLGQRPIFEIIKSKEFVDLELSPLPQLWLENI